MEQRNFKRLAPAPARPGAESQVSLPTQGSRRNITRNACSPCKIKKAKCDGNRPKCGRCQKNGDACLYEVNRRDIAKLQLMSDSDTARLQNLNIIFAVLQHGTDEQAAELFGQIRLGKSTEILASTYDIPSFHRSTSVPYETSAVFPGGPSTACDDPEDPSTAGMSSGFLDLLDRNNWAQSAETTTSYNQIIDDERAELVHDSTHAVHSRREHPC